jgi:hypothetical protein
MQAIPFLDDSCDPAVRGFLHSPETPSGNAIVLTHGAGSNCNAPLLIALSEIFAENHFVVLRCDLPFRQKKPTGPPFPGNAERDRDGLRNAVTALRKNVSGQIFLGGHSYGGRQGTILCATEHEVVSGLLLLSYPLHPPRKPEQLRTQHFPTLRTPSLFIHGTRDPFGSIEEVRSALQLIPAKTELIAIDDAGHDLGYKGKTRSEELPRRILAKFKNIFP